MNVTRLERFHVSSHARTAGSRAPLGVAQEPERQAELLRPGEIALGQIGRDPDDLSVERGELRLVVPEPGEFTVSAPGERLHVERDDDEVALRSASVRRNGRAACWSLQRRLRGLLVDREWLVAVGGGRRSGQQRGEQDDKRLQDVSTAWSTAPRKSCSGTAPSNWTRSLMTTFGTPMT